MCFISWVVNSMVLYYTPGPLLTCHQIFNQYYDSWHNNVRLTRLLIWASDKHVTKYRLNVSWPYCPRFNKISDPYLIFKYLVQICQKMTFLWAQKILLVLKIVFSIQSRFFMYNSIIRFYLKKFFSSIWSRFL